MNAYRMIVAVLAGSLIVAASAGAQNEKLDLRPHWKQGQTSAYRVISERKLSAQITGPMGDNQSSATMRVEGEVAWEVLEASPDGGGVARLTTRKMQFSMTNDKGRTLTADERRADEEIKEMRNLIKAYVDTPITAHIAADGTIEKLEGLDDMQSRAGELGESITENDLKDMVRETVLLSGATDAMQMGDSWKHEYQTTVTGKAEAQVKLRYELMGAEEIAGVPVAAVSGQGEVKIKKPELPPHARFKQTEGEENSQTYFDLTRHEVIGRNVDTVVGFRVEISLGGETITQQTTIHLNGQVLRIEEK